MTRYQAPTQHGHMLSSVAGACLPNGTTSSIAIPANPVHQPRLANLEATQSWFGGRDLSVKRERQAVIT